jgi:single-strand DNA-binding protein
MASINEVVLLGNLGSDPEVHAGANGTIVNLSIATKEVWKDKQQQRQERTEWHRVVCYGVFADVAKTYLQKGAQVYIKGKLQTRKWQDKQTGADRYTTEVVCLEIKMLSGTKGRSATPAAAPQPAGQNQHPQAQSANNADSWLDDFNNSEAEHFGGGGSYTNRRG